MKPTVCGLIICLVLSLGQPAIAQDYGFSSAWPELSPEERALVMSFGEDFKSFMGRAKSEMWFVREGVQYAESQGFLCRSYEFSAADYRAFLIKPTA